MKRYLLGGALVAALALGACGASPATPGAPGAGQAAPAAVNLAQLPNALRDNPDVVLIDVREQEEYDAGHIPGVKLIPLGQLQQRLAEIPTDKTVVVTCRSGNRSGQGAVLLRQSGFSRVHNMDGGILAWEAAGLPVER
jgi:rhodanese-related sulfurtransferase